MNKLSITKITDINLSRALVDKNYILDKEVASLEGDMLWTLCKFGVPVVRIMEKYNINFGDIIINYSKLAGLKSASPDEFSFAINKFNSSFNKKAVPIFTMLRDCFFNKNKNAEFEEVIIQLINKDKKMNKFEPKDLRTGHVCLHANGSYSMVVKDTYERMANMDNGNVVFNSGNRTGIKEYNSDFTWYANTSEHEKRMAIVKVFEPVNICSGFIIFENKFAIETNSKNWKVVWEREEIVELTIAEVSKLLGKNVKIIG